MTACCTFVVCGLHHNTHSSVIKKRPLTPVWSVDVEADVDDQMWMTCKSVYITCNVVYVELSSLHLEWVLSTRGVLGRTSRIVFSALEVRPNTPLVDKTHSRCREDDSTYTTLHVM